MGNTTPEERRAAIISKAIKLHRPYQVFKDPNSKGGYLIRYTSPKDTSRKLVMENIPDKVTAKEIREMLEEAWAEGLYAFSSV